MERQRVAQPTRPRSSLAYALVLVTALLLALASVCMAQDSAQHPKTNHDPDAANLVASDLENFLRAYAQASSAATPAEKEAIYQHEYLDKGSPGLKDFLRLRIESAQKLVQAIGAHPKYYASLKEVVPRVAEMEPAIRTSLRKLKDLYSDAVFPDVYFLIGVMNSGGTTGDSGLLIGLEMHAKTPNTDMSEMGSWHKAVLGLAEELPGIVAHELIHYQQRRGVRTLLSKSIREGSADFIGEMISGQTINKHLRDYGNTHEAE